MIKLFWNTQNQDKPNPNKPHEENARDKLWGIYHKDYSGSETICQNTRRESSQSQKQYLSGHQPA